MKTREELLERMLNKFILISLQGEVLGQILLGNENISLKQSITSAKEILVQPINVVYADTIEILEEGSQDKTKEELLDFITDLVEGIKNDIL
jgi:hypothetical protein